MSAIGRSGCYPHGFGMVIPEEADVFVRLVGVAVEAELGLLRTRGVSAEAVGMARSVMNMLRATAALVPASEPSERADPAGVMHSRREVTREAAAEVIGVSAEYVGRLCRAGRLDARKADGRWLIDESSVLAMRDHREAGAA